MSQDDWFEDGWDPRNDVIRDREWRKNLRERQAAVHARLDAAAGDLAPRALVEPEHLLTRLYRVSPRDADMVEFLKRQDLRARDEERNPRCDMMDAAEREGTWLDQAEDYGRCIVYMPDGRICGKPMACDHGAGGCDTGPCTAGLMPGERCADCGKVAGGSDGE